MGLTLRPRVTENSFHAGRRLGSFTGASLDMGSWSRRRLTRAAFFLICLHQRMRGLDWLGLIDLRIMGWAVAMVRSMVKVFPYRKESASM